MVEHQPENQPAAVNCLQCGFEFSATRISCPSCGMPVPKTAAQTKTKFVRYFIALVVFCALVILIAPR